MFNKLIAITVIAAATISPALAQHRGHNEYRGGGDSNWVAPLIIGSIIGYGVSQANKPEVVYTQPVIVQQEPVYTRPPVYVERPAPVMPPQQVYEQRWVWNYGYQRWDSTWVRVQ
jgi:hypothetical protein